MAQQPMIDSDLLCNLYSLELCPNLNVSPNSLPLLVGEPNSDTKEFRKSILQLVESIGIPKIFISKKGLLHAYSHGLSNAMIFESGAISSSLVVVEDGYVH
jgi:actin-related protein